MSIEELLGISFFFNHSATEKARESILFDEYWSELNRIFEDEVIKEQNNGNVS